MAACARTDEDTISKEHLRQADCAFQPLLGKYMLLVRLAIVQYLEQKGNIRAESFALEHERM